MPNLTFRQQVGKFVDCNELLFSKLEILTKKIESVTTADRLIKMGSKQINVREHLVLLRDAQILQAHLCGIRHTAIAKIYNVSESQVSNVLREFRKKLGIPEDKPRGY